MDQELTDRILQDGLSLEAYLKLCTLKDSIERKLSEKLAKEINHVRQEFGDAFYIEPRKWGQRNQPFYFTSPSLSKAGLKLGFEFESNGYRDCFFGLCWVDEKGSESDSQDWPPAVQRIVALFREKFSKSDSSPHWPAWVYWDEHRNWGALEFNAILSDKFRDSIAATVRRVFGLFEEELIRSTEN